MNKICTDIEQSKKLLELGIDVNTADMYYQYYKSYSSSGGITEGHCDIPVIGSWKEHHISIPDPAMPNADFPAWSLVVLLGIIPKHIKNYNVLRIDISDNDFAIWYDEIGYGVNNNLPNITMESAVDACYEMIIKLKEQNLL